MGKSLLVFALGIGFLMIPFSIHAEVYKWIDDKGTVHFTDEYSTIPEKYIPSTKIQNLPKESPRPSIDEKLNPAVAPKSPEPLVQETPTPRLFSGTISSVGSEIIVVRDEEKEMAFSISENSIIKTENGELIALDKLWNAGYCRVYHKGQDLSLTQHQSKLYAERFRRDTKKKTKTTTGNQVMKLSFSKSPVGWPRDQSP